MTNTASIDSIASARERVAVPASAGKYLTFRIGGEEYGIEILRVQEIRSYESPMRISGAPENVIGVINLRGVIVPLVDLRMKLRCEHVVYDTSTVVIVLNVANRVIGAVVDSVSDVTNLEAASIHRAPRLHTSFDTEFITGIGHVDKQMLILVDIGALMSDAELGTIEDGLVENA